MCVLYTYSYALLDDLKEKIRNDGNEIVSFSAIEVNKPTDDRLYFVDITSLTTAMLIPNNTTFIAEKIICGFEFAHKLLIDEKYGHEAKDLFRFNIDKIEKLELFTVEDGPVESTEIYNRKLVTELSDEQIDDLHKFIRIHLIGQDNFKEKFIEQIKKFRIFNKLNESKILSVFLLGRSGVGKTEIGRLVHSYLSPDTKPVKINFGNYSSKDSLNTLIGSPKGYIGSDNGELNEKVRKSKTGIIIIDEFEKADEKVFNFFLELLEDGKFTDTQNIEYDLNGFVIFFTSNLSSANFSQKIPSELISRFNYICEFCTLSYENKKNYVLKRYNEIVSNYNAVFEKDKHQITDIDEISIDVADFENIRNLNEEIRKVFLNQLG